MDWYSRLVAWLKVLLPLVALGLLSTLFFLSRSYDPKDSIPFAEADIRDRVQNERVTSPKFAGTTRSGDRVLVTADSMMTGPETGNRAVNLKAQVYLASGIQVIFASQSGSLDIQEKLVRLEGAVNLSTSSGFEFRTEKLMASFDNLSVVSPGPVTGISPFGTLKAGTMRLARLGAEDNAHLLFTNGVNLIYNPRGS